MKEAQNNNNEGGAGYYRQLIANDRTEQANQQKKLNDLLSKSEYDGTITYDIMGDKYNRITVEDMKAKQLTLEAAQKTAEQSKQTFEQATRGLEQAKKAIIVAQAQLKDATITAPFNGLISSVDVKQGDFIAPLGSTTGTLVYMVDPNSLELNVEIDEIDVPGVKVGQKAFINLDALPEVKFEGRVTNVSMLPVVKPQNSGVVVYEVKVVFDGKPPAEVKSGMSASVDILTGMRQNVLLIPNKSIKRDSQGKPVVQVLEKDKMTEKAVVLGKSDGVQTEVLKGLQSGEIIILTQQKAGLATAKS
jgi:HlyD family secretion protein